MLDFDEDYNDSIRSAQNDSNALEVEIVTIYFFNFRDKSDNEVKRRQYVTVASLSDLISGEQTLPNLSEHLSQVLGTKI